MNVRHSLVSESVHMCRKKKAVGGDFKEKSFFFSISTTFSHTLFCVQAHRRARARGQGGRVNMEYKKAQQVDFCTYAEEMAEKSYVFMLHRKIYSHTWLIDCLFPTVICGIFRENLPYFFLCSSLCLILDELS